MGTAIDMKPALIPDDELRARDNSGGMDWKPYTAEFGDGGYVCGGAKPHLSAGAKGQGTENGDEDMAERRQGRRGRAG